ncbi:MAG: ATP-dependent DNA helicase [Defluviitaleaceae bacterium]|nr:ATP-dependent DNA helicase [Defluviitaleaceae bacterium]
MAESLGLSVRKITDLVLRGGDIDFKYNDSFSLSEGTAAHRKIQKEMTETHQEAYQKEVSLSLETDIFGIPVIIKGRADGIITDPTGGVTIDEIKSTTLPLDYFYQQQAPHLGQAKCYAFMYMQTLENPPAAVTIQLTHYQLETGETRRYTSQHSAADIAAFFADLLEKYGVWLRMDREWEITRNAAIHALTFPFPAYRKGQRELAVAAYRAIAAGKNLYACAPTGIGKTLSSLFPAIKAMGEGKTAPLFYLTAKTVTRTVAEEAVRLMAARGLRFKAITLRAKEKICVNADCICTPQNCAYAKGHYDRVNDAVLDMLEHNDLITPAETEFYALKHQVCPHEMALDAALWCDLVVGDYNHVFHPDAYLRRFFNDDKRDYVFLIDEAHNLADRVRDMYSTGLRKSTLSQVRTGLKDKDKLSVNLRKGLRLLNAYLSDMRKEHEGRHVVTPTVDMVFVAFVKMAVEATGEWLAAKAGHSLHGDILELYFEMNKFLMIAELFDQDAQAAGAFTTITEFYGKDVTMTLFCLDPSKIIADRLSLAKSSVIFSATLLPLPYYRDILGGSAEDLMVSLPSPFDPQRLRLVSRCDISTKYRNREGSYAPIARAIFDTVSGKPGNYMVFFPSYEYMHKVYDIFCAQHPGVETIMQQSEMSEDERAAFLARFDERNTQTLVGFTVLGGIFSEGIDLKGDRLIGSIIVGVGIPKISLRQDLIRDYFNERNGQGYDYAYVFPGMNKVLQAAGRVIRTETDEGVVMLIDSRYATGQYKRLFPAHWAHMETQWS